MYEAGTRRVVLQRKGVRDGVEWGDENGNSPWTTHTAPPSRTSHPWHQGKEKEKEAFNFSRNKFRKMENSQSSFD